MLVIEINGRKYELTGDQQRRVEAAAFRAMRTPAGLVSAHAEISAIVSERSERMTNIKERAAEIDQRWGRLAAEVEDAAREVDAEGQNGNLVRRAFEETRAAVNEELGRAAVLIGELRAGVERLTAERDAWRALAKSRARGMRTADLDQELDRSVGVPSVAALRALGVTDRDLGRG